jgi:hypothetical protein
MVSQPPAPGVNADTDVKEAYARFRAESVEKRTKAAY